MKTFLVKALPDGCAVWFVNTTIPPPSGSVRLHLILKRLLNIGLSEQAVGWCVNYLSDRYQCFRFEGSSFTIQYVSPGVPQGSALGPILLTI